MNSACCQRSRVDVGVVNGQNLLHPSANRGRIAGAELIDICKGVSRMELAWAVQTYRIGRHQPLGKISGGSINETRRHVRSCRCHPGARHIPSYQGASLTMIHQP